MPCPRIGPKKETTRAKHRIFYPRGKWNPQNQTLWHVNEWMRGERRISIEGPEHRRIDEIGSGGGMC